MVVQQFPAHYSLYHCVDGERFRKTFLKKNIPGSIAPGTPSDLVPPRLLWDVRDILQGTYVHQ